jgi:hypothetical protein
MGRDRGEVAPRAVAADREPRVIEPERRRIAAEPSSRRDAILDGPPGTAAPARAVIHGRHRAAGRVSEDPADHVVGVEVADDPPPP